MRLLLLLYEPCCYGCVNTDRMEQLVLLCTSTMLFCIFLMFFSRGINARLRPLSRLLVTVTFHFHVFHVYFCASLCFIFRVCFCAFVCFFSSLLRCCFCVDSFFFFGFHASFFFIIFFFTFYFIYVHFLTIFIFLTHFHLSKKRVCHVFHVGFLHIFFFWRN